MFSEEQRRIAIETFIKYDHSYADTVAELGYPNRATLRLWWREYESTGEIPVGRGHHRKSKYTTAIGRRDLTFMMVMYATGARLDEVRSLTAGQVHLDAPRPYVNLLGKGGKARTGYLLPRACRVVRAYMREALGPHPDAGTLLFPSRVGGGKMSEPAWDKRIKAYAAIAHESCPDVPIRAHAHQLRHAAASHWLDAGMSVVEVQHMLGHEQLSTTMRYLDVQMQQKSKAMAVLESEDDRKKTKKWRNPDGTLVDFLGLGGR